MKIQLLCLLTLGIGFVACKKNNKQSSPVPPSKTYKIIFNAQSSSLGVDVASKKAVNSLGVTSTPSSVATVLYYIVTDTGKNIIRIIGQDSTSANFGRIVDNLAAGQYLINLIAGQKNLIIDNPNNSRVDDPTAKTVSYFTTVQNSQTVQQPTWWEDNTFTAQFPLTVTDADVTETVTLNRLVAKLQVHINDAIPATVSYISVTIVNDYYYYDYMNQTYVDLGKGSYSPSFKVVITPSLAGQPNLDITTPALLNTFKPINVLITAYDKNSAIVANKSVTVQLQKNKRTVLSGNLFTGNGNISVSGINDWDSTPYKTITF